MKVIAKSLFYHDGRGPQLVRVHLAPRSSHLLAIDYSPPDCDDINIGLRHLLFSKAQVYMFTPEEVENYQTTAVNWGATDRGAMVSLGKTQWLRSFSQRHLERCEHYRVMFYDEFLDVICEGVAPAEGPYAAT